MRQHISSTNQHHHRALDTTPTTTVATTMSSLHSGNNYFVTNYNKGSDWNLNFEEARVHFINIIILNFHLNTKYSISFLFKTKNSIKKLDNWSFLQNENYFISLTLINENIMNLNFFKMKSMIELFSTLNFSFNSFI